MFRSRWFPIYLGMARFGKDCRQTSRPRRSVRLTLESLEDRVVPAVNSGADLLAALKPGGNVTVTLGQSFTLTNTPNTQSVEITAGTSLTINGAGKTLTAAADSRLFQVDRGATLTLKNLTLTGGSVTNSTGTAAGGAILDQGGAVTLNGATVQASKVTGGTAEGGGVFVSGGGTLTVKGGSIQGNTATGGTSKNGFGGGIFDQGGAVTISSNANISGNTVSGNYAEGGGIFVSGGGKLTVLNSTISQNNAVGANNVDVVYNINRAPISGGVFGVAAGGGVCVLGPSSVQITHSTLDHNAAYGGTGILNQQAGRSGFEGGWAYGGGLYAGLSGWTATFVGDTLSNNKAVGGNGGDGGAGSNGGDGGTGDGGGAYVTVSGSGGGNGTLMVLNDVNAPATSPSRWFGNSAQGGAGGDGGGGGATAATATGGSGGSGGNAYGGALGVGNFYLTPTGALTVNIGNTTFYGNNASGGTGGAGGAAGTGGKAGAGGGFVSAWGGGLDLEQCKGAMVNCTLAKNTVSGGLNNAGTKRGSEYGGGVHFYNGSLLFYNNTVTFNSLNSDGVNGGAFYLGAGVFVDGAGAPPLPSLINNLIENNSDVVVIGSDLEVASTLGALKDATNNFIGSISATAVNGKTNIIGNPQVQLDKVVGVDADGKPTGGPIYYPLKAGVVSVGAGNTNVLNSIASIEGTTPDKTTDEIGNPRSRTNPPKPPPNGSIDLGAIQSVEGGGGGNGGGGKGGGGGGAVCTCAASAAASANQTAENLGTYLGNLEAQLFQSVQTVLTTFSAVVRGQQPLTNLVQSLLQFYQVSFAIEALAQEPAFTPEAFAATGGGESFAASSSAVPE